MVAHLTNPGITDSSAPELLLAKIDRAALERETQRLAEVLLRQSQPSSSLLGQLQQQLRWDDRLMQWAMTNESLRLYLFQLIDCLPSLSDKTAIARHIQEYLNRPDIELPQALKTLINFATPDALPGQVAATTMVTSVEALAHRYIAGVAVADGLQRLTKLAQQGLGFTVDLLGEAVISDVEADQYVDRYRQWIQALGAAQFPAAKSKQPTTQLVSKEVSVKLTAFAAQVDPLDWEGSQRRLADRIRPLLRLAKDQGCSLHFDMEQVVYKDLTLATLKVLLVEPEFRDRQDIGLTIQAYLRESRRDLLGLIDWAKERGTPVTVRLVKGAYWDQEVIRAIQKDWPLPVYEQKAETDQNFEVLTDLLLANWQSLRPAIASHNPRSQGRAIALAQALGIPATGLEFQMLYGMGDRLAAAMREMGYGVRIYCPMGELIPGMAYLTRRLLENTANSSFLRQQADRSQNSQADFADLIAPPKVVEATTTPAASAASQEQVAIFQNVADRDYSQAAQREAALKALQTVRQQLGQTYSPWVAGQALVTLKTVDSVNPANPREVIGKIGMASEAQALEAIQAAQAAFPIWRNWPVAGRAEWLRRSAQLLEQQRDELAAWITLEVGKTLGESNGEVSEAIDFCRYYAAEMERLDAGTDAEVPGETNHYRYQPRGVVTIISPWNFPLAIALGMTVAALVTGNVVVLKPATVAAVVAVKFGAILTQAGQELGIPAGVLNILPGEGRSVGRVLVEHPQVAMIGFTGSQAVGAQIYATAAQLRPGQRQFKRVVAEMGGKNAIVVDDSADLDQAVEGVVQSAFGYSGQKCSACSRVIVLESIYDRFLARLRDVTQSLRVGPGEEPSTQMGPVIDGVSQAKLLAVIAELQASASVQVESLALPPALLQADGSATGYFVGPTLVTNVQPDMPIAQEELFGPVLAVLRAKDFETALAIVNDSVYALTGGLYSRTPSHIERAKRDLAVGNLYINRGITGALVGRQPFGGFQLSGVGSKAGGPDYLLQFLEPRVVTENIQRQGFAPIER